MNGLTNAARTLARSIVIAACVAALALAAAQRAGATEPYNPAVGAGVHASQCKAGGGTVRPDSVDRTVGQGLKSVGQTCVGGLLDGWSCQFIMDSTFCDGLGLSSGDRAAEAPDAEIVAEPDPQRPAIEGGDGAIAPIEVTEEPGVTEPAGDEGADPAQDAPGGDVEGGAADEGAAGEGAGGALPADAEDLPEYAAEDEAPAAGGGDPAADADQGAGGGEAVAAQDTAETDGLFFEEDDQQP